jgi:hypothetical protein
MIFGCCRISDQSDSLDLETPLTLLIVPFMFVRDMRMFVTTFLQKYIFKSIVFICYIFFNLKKIRKYLQIRRDAKSNFLNNSTF